MEHVLIVVQKWMVIKLLTSQEKNFFRTMVNNWGDGMIKPGKIADIDYVLRFWKEEKSKYLFKLFGNKLILSKEINYERGTSELIDILYSKQEYICAYKKFRGILNAEDRSYFSVDNFVSNSISSEYISAGRVYPAGTKLSKLLALWGKLYNRPQEAQELINVISKVRQTHKSKGKFCLSIHPLDYLTASTNEYGWNSCLEFFGGEYSRGTVCAMNSPCLVVAYLSSLNGSWESKKWRQFYIVTEDLIVPVKQYPYQDPHLERIATEWLRELSGDNFKFRQELNTTFFTNNILYNDLKTENPYGYLREGAEEPDKLWFDGPDECLICGEEGYFDEEGQIYCNDCAYVCSECGTLINWYSEFHTINPDGTIVCSDCQCVI